MTCIRCAQLLLWRFSQDEDGRRFAEDYCPSCGWIKDEPRVQKQIEVTKGQIFA